MITLLIVTKDKYEVLNQNLNKYLTYNFLDEILIYDNSENNAVINENLLECNKIKIFRDKLGINTGLYGGLNFLMNISKSKTSKFFVILDDDAFIHEKDFLNILNHHQELQNDVGVSLHLSFTDNNLFTEPIYSKQSIKGLIYSLNDFNKINNKVFVDSAPNIGIVISEKLMKKVIVPDADLFFCGESFLFDNFKEINARLFYLNDVKVYHKSHSFKVINIPFTKKQIKISIV